MDSEEIGFTRGVVYVIAQMIRFGDESIAGFIWCTSGFTPEDVKVCAEYDVAEIRKIMPHLPQGEAE